MQWLRRLFFDPAEDDSTADPQMPYGVAASNPSGGDRGEAPKQIAFHESEFARLRPKLGGTLAEILAAGRAGSWQDALWAIELLNSWKRVHGDDLTDVEAAIQAAAGCAIDFEAGGVAGYFENAASDSWPGMLRWVSALGDDDALAVFSDALSLFPGNAPSTHRAMRWEQIEALAELSEEDGDPFAAVQERWSAACFPTPEQRWAYVDAHAEGIEAVRSI